MIIIIYIVNRGNDEIIAFDTVTPGFSLFCSPGSSFLNSPYGITIDNIGQNLYVTNTQDNLGNYFVTKIPILTPLSLVVYYSSSTFLSTPVGIVFDSNNNLYITNTSVNTTSQYFITKIDATATATAFYATSDLNLLDYPHELAILNNYLYITNVNGTTTPGFITAINLNGTNPLNFWLAPNGIQLSNIIFNNLGNMFISCGSSTNLNSIINISNQLNFNN